MYKTGFYGGKFMPFHRGHLNCILRAASQCEHLYVVLMYNGREELDIIQNQDIRFNKKYLTPHIRELALRKELNDFPNIEVIAYDSKPADDRAEQEGRHPWYYECEDMVNLMGKFDVCYSSESEYSEYFREFYPWADAVILDEGREVEPISGTELRNMPFSQAYPHLPRAYQQLVNKTVLFVGTCSCGKTTTVRKLARYFNTSYSEEQGRLISEGFKKISSPGVEYYNQFICSQYMDNIKAKEDANMVALLDTDSIITNFYAELYEEDGLPVGDALSKETQYDLILFFEPTVPFVADGMRTHREEEQRWDLSDKLKKMYTDKYNKKIKILNGTYEENYINAVNYIKDMLEE